MGCVCVSVVMHCLSVYLFTDYLFCWALVHFYHTKYVCTDGCVRVLRLPLYFLLVILHISSQLIYDLTTLLHIIKISYPISKICYSHFIISTHFCLYVPLCVCVWQINAIAAHLITNMSQIEDLLGAGADFQTVCALVSTSTSLVLKRYDLRHSFSERTLLRTYAQ